MPNRYDQFGKQMVRAAIEDCCVVETDAEVPADTRRIDLWLTPREPRRPLPEHLGLLGHIAGVPGTLEFFHNTPSGNELAACLIKQGEFRHLLSQRMTSPLLRLPIQWIISSGRPDAGIEGLAFHPMPGWPSGFYSGPKLLWTHLVVVNELPIARHTLLLRLLGAGAVLRRAVAELRALPADAPERMLAFPILVRLRLAVPSEPAQRTPDEKEFLMDTEDVYDAWYRKTIQEGLEQGRAQVIERERTLLLRLLRQRFGERVDSETERRVGAASGAQIELWLERVVSAATLGELLAV